MGIDLAIAQHLFELSRKIDFRGRVLMLERQQIHASTEDLAVIRDRATAMGLHFPLDELQSNGMYAEPFFKMLGFDDCESLDASAYEDCTHEHSLGLPLPTHLHGVYDFVFDGGTTEHVFDQAAVCKNIFDLLKSMGHLCTVVPANGYFGHGFYQFSPEFPWSFWQRSCGFEVVDCVALPKDAARATIALPDPETLGTRLTPDLPAGKVYLCYTAQKSPGARWQINAQQSDYVATWRRQDAGPVPSLQAAPSPLSEAQIDQAIADNDIPKMFPISGQTTGGDRKFLLSVIGLMRQRNQPYSYLEIGSFMGGSLAPFLLDSQCAAITSVDDRGKIQNDERGLKFDYTPFSTEAMLQRIADADLPAQKLTCFDGPISAYDGGGQFDLIHIDAIHTDEAVFEDFLAARPLLKKSGIMLFHDYDLIFRGVEMAHLLLESEGTAHAIAIRPDSLFCAVFFGDCVPLAASIGETGDEARKQRMNTAMKKRVLDQFKNRSFLPSADGPRKFEVPDDVMIVDEETRSIPNA